MDYKKIVRNIPDFPQKGITFRDISPLLENKDVLKDLVKTLVNKISNLKIDKVVGIDARGFILSGIIAEKIGAGMVMARKKGKLPFETVSEEYELEYGKASLEIHRDSIKKGENVLLVDDVLATGGTMAAAARLIERVGGKVQGILFLIILDYLPGKEKLKNYNLYSLINFEK